MLAQGEVPGTAESLCPEESEAALVPVPVVGVLVQQEVYGHMEVAIAISPGADEPHLALTST